MLSSTENPNATHPPTSPASDQPLPQRGWISRFGWMLPILVAIVVYGVSFNNYFAYDDFIWLNRARTFKDNWLQIFRPDVVYFDPLVHLLFWANSQVGGLNPSWYHGVDLAIHAANSFLVYRFIKLLSGNDKTALYGSILFASSFAIVDAVVWSSSRVDILSTLCSMGVLIQFLLYLRFKRKRNLFFSILLFILSLCAKGTPLLLPLVPLWLIIQEKKPLRHAASLVPFGAVIVIYLALLKMTMHQASLPLERLHFNIRNTAIALSALFIPEGILDKLDLPTTATLLFAVISALGLLAIRGDTTLLVRRTGYCILVVAILPVLIVTDFRLFTGSTPAYMVLLSPSHRIYLASIGAALLCGGFLAYLEASFGRFFHRFTTIGVAIILTGIVGCNFFLVRERNKVWQSLGDGYRNGVAGLLNYQGKVAEGSQIALINFTGSRGFVTPMLNLCFGADNITVIKELVIGFIEDPEILRNAEKSHLFILGNDGYVYDKSELFRKQLLFNRMALQDPKRPEYESRCMAVAKQLDLEVIEIFSRTNSRQ